MLEEVCAHYHDVHGVAVGDNGETVVYAQVTTTRVSQKQGGRWECDDLGGHDSDCDVLSVVMSRDGSHVVSGSSDNVLRLWKKLHER